MPLLMCSGAAGDKDKGQFYQDDFAGVDIPTNYWGGDGIEIAMENGTGEL